METKTRNFIDFKLDLNLIREFIGPHLSEPYTIFTYYYFLTYYPHLTFSVTDMDDNLLGILVGRTEDINKKSSKADTENMEDYVKPKKGYIAMLVIDPKLRGQGYGQKLITLFIDTVNLF